MPVAWQCRRCKGPALPTEWEGPCPNCGGYYRANRIYTADGEVEGAEAAKIEEGEPISAGDLMKIITQNDLGTKIETGMQGLDWVFGGGLPKRGAILLCAPAGCGKSTLLIELFRHLAKQKRRTMYISAEQTLIELGMQFSWLGSNAFPAKYMSLMYATDKDDIFHAIEKHRADVYAIDSLHTIENVTDIEGFSLATGGTAAVAQLGRDIKRLAGEREALIFCVGHVNNDGTVAGGAHVRHMLDATLVLRQPPSAAEHDPVRVLSFEGKNRFGPRGRRAIFEMRPTGFVDCGPLTKDDGGEDIRDEQ